MLAVLKQSLHNYFLLKSSNEVCVRTRKQSHDLAIEQLQSNIVKKSRDPS